MPHLYEKIREIQPWVLTHFEKFGPRGRGRRGPQPLPLRAARSRGCRPARGLMSGTLHAACIRKPCKSQIECWQLPCMHLRHLCTRQGCQSNLWQMQFDFSDTDPSPLFYFLVCVSRGKISGLRWL